MKKLLTSLFIAAFVLVPTSGVLAVEEEVAVVAEPDTFGLTNVNTGLGGSLGLNNAGLIGTIADIINIALGLLGIVAVVIILIGGFRWMTAAGREDQIDSAKQTIFAGIIGLAIILSSWALATFVISSLSNATNSGDVGAGFGYLMSQFLA